MAFDSFRRARTLAVVMIFCWSGACVWAQPDQQTNATKKQDEESKHVEGHQVPADLFVDEATPKNDLCVGVCPDQAFRSLQVMSEERMVVEPNVVTPGMRDSHSAHVGFSAAVFPKAAPATVLVRTKFGHGTGFIIDKEGWILTNEHVINAGAVDKENGALFAQVHLGKLVDGFMVPREKTYKAYIHSASERKDLALLKLIDKTDFELPVIPLASKPSTPGQACVTIGHPTSGLLWTLRKGEVAGVGRWPQDMMQNMFLRFSLQGEELAQFQKVLKESPSRKAMISTVGINPGDSGGPLLNTRGELIAVNFAVPKIDLKKGVSLDKFSYHVHLDEVKDFVNERPASPPVHVPPVFPVADKSNMFDKDNDGKYESWVFNFESTSRPVGVLVDLDDDTSEAFARKFANRTAHQSEFDFEYAFQNFPISRTFYDTDNDGHVDWILTDLNNDQYCDFAVALVKGPNGKGNWEKKVTKERQPMRDFTLFKDEKFGKRLEFLYNTTVQGKTLGSSDSTQPGR